MCTREKEIFVTVWTRVSKKESVWKGNGWIRFAKFLSDSGQKDEKCFHVMREIQKFLPSCIHQYEKKQKAKISDMKYEKKQKA